MKEQQIIKIIIILYSVLIFLLSFVANKSIDDNLFRWISSLISLVVIIWTAYDKFFWRKWIFKKINQFFHIPILYGTWKGKIKYENNEFGKNGEVDVYVAINQTLMSVTVRAFFKKPSESRSITAKVEKDELNRKKLVYMYESTAPYGKRDNNRPHDGACVLNIVGNPVKKLSGSYFTERKGAGLIVLNGHSDILAESYEDSNHLEYN